MNDLQSEPTKHCEKCKGLLHTQVVWLCKKCDQDKLTPEEILEQITSPVPRPPETEIEPEKKLDLRKLAEFLANHLC